MLLEPAAGVVVTSSPVVVECSVLFVTVTGDVDDFNRVEVTAANDVVLVSEVPVVN